MVLTFLNCQIYWHNNLWLFRSQENQNKNHQTVLLMFILIIFIIHALRLAYPVLLLTLSCILSPTYLYNKPVRVNDSEKRQKVYKERISYDVAPADPILREVISPTGCHITFRNVPESFHVKRICYLLKNIINATLKINNSKIKGLCEVDCNFSTHIIYCVKWCLLKLNGHVIMFA